MQERRRRRRSLSFRGGAIALCLSALALGAHASAASAAGAPVVGKVWAEGVEARSAHLSAEINPNGLFTNAYLEYITKAGFEAGGFAGAKKVILSSPGSGSAAVLVHVPTLTGLAPQTTYLYRLTATNSAGPTVAPPAPPYPFFTTQPLGGGALLPDSRGWEMVSPVAKNGGQVDPPGSLAAGGVLQASSGDGLITYSSAASFEGGAGAPPASQYLATRTASGWASENITVPIFSGSYDLHEGGSPYRLFSADLARGLLFNGKSCRGEESSGCPVANPTLPGTDAPAGYQDYYLRETSSGGFEALLGSSETSLSGQSASQFEVSLAGASADLGHVVLASCAKLSADASEGCPGQANLYRRSAGGGPLELINASPGAALAAQGANAVSQDGARVYFYEGADLWLRDGGALKQADAGAGGGGAFQLASTDGSLAYFTQAGDLYRYSATADTATALTSTADVKGVLGAAGDGSSLYYLRSTGLYRCAAAQSAGAGGCDAATKIAAAADAGNYPPATGTARVSADGTKLLFVSTEPLADHLGNTYDNTDLATGEPDSELFLYDAAGVGLSCLSCNPTNARPIGPSSIPGAIANGAGPTATIAYKPRVLVDGGRRVFFDSADALALADVNGDPASGAGIADAYQWEAQGEGGCSLSGGCVSLISSGRDPAPSAFADASASGADAYFLTEASLVGADPGGLDLYDARIGGGFAEAGEPIPCKGDACQVLPPEPVDPTLTTLLSGAGNPPVHYSRYGVKAQKRCPKGKVAKTVKGKGGKQVKKCVKKKAKPHAKGKAGKGARR